MHVCDQCLHDLECTTFMVGRPAWFGRFPYHVLPFLPYSLFVFTLYYLFDVRPDCLHSLSSSITTFSSVCNPSLRFFFNASFLSVSLPICFPHSYLSTFLPAFRAAFFPLLLLYPPAPLRAFLSLLNCPEGCREN